MPAPATLSDFFAQMPTRVDLYHLGRRIAPCTRHHFAAFEQEQVAWAYPFRHEARVAVVLHGDRAEDSRIWCIALPLDELGQLQFAPRDMLLQRLMEAGGPPGETSDPLKDNPLAFAPDEMTRALLHAHICKAQGLPLSDVAQQAGRYLLAPGQDDALHWKMLNVQGVADWVVALDTTTSERLATQLASLPDDVVQLLCRCLEHAPTESAALIDALHQHAQRHQALHLACLRAGLSSPLPDAARWLDYCLTAAPDAEVLAIISARGWHHLEDAERLPRYLEALAQCSALNFREALRDLASLPRLRLPVVMALRDAPAASVLKQRLADSGLR